MFHVALTGNIAAGKSTVAEQFVAGGALLIDADALVRELQTAGTPVHAAIVRRFGPAIVAPGGALDRAALRARVLADSEARADLEAIVHPAVAERRTELVAAAAAGAGAADLIVVSDIPLLFEAADPDAFDLVVLVDALPETRRARLIERRGLSPEEADRLLAAQAPSEPKRARSDIVIDNDGTPEALVRAARAAWERIRAAAAHRA